MKKLIAAFIAVYMILGMQAFAEEKIKIVATDFPCYDFARQVAGDWADVNMLIKPGMEVHAFDPAPSDILAIGQADLFIYIGGESDAWVENILASFDEDTAPKKIRMMEVVECVETEGHEHHHGTDYDHDEPTYDEHIWLSPENAMKMVEAVKMKMQEIDPDHSDEYAQAADACVDDIKDIDAAFREIVKNSKRNKLIFADRFPFIYLMEAYGIDYAAAFESCTAETEPSPLTMMALIDEVVGNDIPVIYTIEMSSQNVARVIAEDTGADILTLHSIQTVSQAEFEAGESYVSLMEKNVEAIKRGLN